MDDTPGHIPWFDHLSFQDLRGALIPDKMGAFKTYFHQANLHCQSFVYMRIWLGHKPEMATSRHEVVDAETNRPLSAFCSNGKHFRY
jgi:hypothetical protein